MGGENYAFSYRQVLDGSENVCYNVTKVKYMTLQIRLEYSERVEGLAFYRENG